MKIIQGGVPEMIKESVKDVSLANKITHQLWREDNTLLGYILKNDEDLSISIYPLREIDIGQLYAELDIQNLKDYSISTSRSQGLDLVDSINKAERSQDLDGLKALKLSRMKNMFNTLMIRPKVPVDLGDRQFNLDGSRDDISNFQSYLDILELNNQSEGDIKDADGIMRKVSVQELKTCIDVLKMSGLSLYQVKWAKEVEIMQAQTIDEVKSVSIKIDPNQEDK